MSSAFSEALLSTLTAARATLIVSNKLLNLKALLRSGDLNVIYPSISAHKRSGKENCPSKKKKRVVLTSLMKDNQSRIS
jgi:hypothetical protein